MPSTRPTCPRRAQMEWINKTFRHVVVSFCISYAGSVFQLRVAGPSLLTRHVVHSCGIEKIAIRSLDYAYKQRHSQRDSPVPAPRRQPPAVPSPTQLCAHGREGHRGDHIGVVPVDKTRRHSNCPYKNENKLTPDWPPTVPRSCVRIRTPAPARPSTRRRISSYRRGSPPPRCRTGRGRRPRRPPTPARTDRAFR